MFEELIEDANGLIDKGKARDAVKILRELKKRSDFNNNARIAELFGAAYSISGDAEKAAAAYLDAAHNDRFLRAQRGHIASYLFLLHYLQDIETAALYRELANFENLFNDVSAFPKKIFNHNKIRIGYLLPIAKKSSLSNFAIALFTKFNRDKFKIYVS